MQKKWYNYGFTVNINNNTPILSDYFEVSVGLVNAYRRSFKNDEIGNFNILTVKKYIQNIYICSYY